MTAPADPEEKTEKPAEDAPAQAAEEAKPAKPPRKPLPTWMVLSGIVIFFILAIGVTYVIWLTVNTLRLTAPETYSNGRVVEKQVFNDIQGWGSELMIDKKPDMPARIRFLLRDQDRKPITDADVQIDMISADDPPQSNTQATLIMKEPGVYRGEVDVPAGGLWEARIRVKEKGNAYQITKRVVVPESDKEKAAGDKAK